LQNLKGRCHFGRPGCRWKTPFGGHRHKWEDNIRRHLRETGWEGMDWTHLAQDRDQWWDLVNMVMNLHILLKMRNSTS